MPRLYEAEPQDKYSYKIISIESVCEKIKVDLDTLVKEATDLFNNLDKKAELDKEDIEKINNLLSRFDNVHKNYYDEINMNFNKKHKELDEKITKLRTFLTTKNNNLIPVVNQKEQEKKTEGGKHSIKRKTKNRKNKKQKTKKFNRRK